MKSEISIISDCIESNTLEIFRFHTFLYVLFVYKSDYWMSVGNDTLEIESCRFHTFVYIKVIIGSQ